MDSKIIPFFNCVVFLDVISQNKIAVLENCIDNIKDDDWLFILQTMGIKCCGKIDGPEKLLTDGYIMSLAKKKVIYDIIILG